VTISNLSSKLIKNSLPKSDNYVLRQLIVNLRVRHLFC